MNKQFLKTKTCAFKEKKIALVQQDTARVFEGKAAEDFLETPRTKVTKIRRGSCR